MVKSCRTVLEAALLVICTYAMAGAQPLVSDATRDCLDCHETYHAGIVADWRNSRHAAATPEAARQVKGPGLKVSGKTIPAELRKNSVGCAECHTMNAAKHKDTFEHNGYQVHVVVSPEDCAVCHTEERDQFSRNIMAMAEKNLAENSLYQDLQKTIIGNMSVKNDKPDFSPANDLTRADSCFYCHGTKVTVRRLETRDTDAGELEFPVLDGWPNQGVGRVNPDGSRGSCSACHTRHQFALEMARKPQTCKECHVGPDVPAYKVYSASKHGNIYASMGDHWNYTHVPWTIGVDFTAPTCAACHISLTVNNDGEVVNPRTHQMSDRLGWRLFGLIYAHPQPKSADTTIIRNKSGLPLPTDLDGSPANAFLITKQEVATRRATMQRTCLNCHATTWVRGYFDRLDNTITASNSAVLAATGRMQVIWDKHLAQGLASGGSMFDEYIERRWSDAWLLYANNIRFVSAMAGGGDYGVFEDGRYHLSKTVMELTHWLASREKNPSN